MKLLNAILNWYSENKHTKTAQNKRIHFYHESSETRFHFFAEKSVGKEKINSLKKKWPKLPESRSPSAQLRMCSDVNTTLDWLATVTRPHQYAQRLKLYQGYRGRSFNLPSAIIARFHFYSLISLSGGISVRLPSPLIALPPPFSFWSRKSMTDKIAGNIWESKNRNLCRKNRLFVNIILLWSSVRASADYQFSRHL